MIKKLLTGLGSLILVLIPVYLGYYLTQKRPDVRYTLSDRIPLSFSSESNSSIVEGIQQLEVRNLGNEKAEKIVSKIAANVTDYEIQKYIASDNVQVFTDQQTFQLVYPELPPQAGFLLIFKTSGDGVNLDDVIVSHDLGIAQEALAKQVSSSFNQIIYWGAFLFYIFLGGISVRNSFVDWWENSMSHKNIELILRTTRPWYAWNRDLLEIQTRAITKIISDDYIHAWNLNLSEAFKLLSLDKPENFPDGKWSQVHERAVDVFSKAYLHCIASASRDTILEILHLKKPTYFPQEKWDKLIEGASKQYVLLCKHQSLSASILQNELHTEKPGEIQSVYWNDLIQYFQEQYFSALMADLYRSDDPSENIKGFDLTLLNSRDKEWLELRLNSIVQFLVERDKYRELTTLLGNIIAGNWKDRQNTGLFDDWEWEQLLRIADGVAMLADVETKELEVAQKILEIDDMKHKVVRQLNIIHEVLTDPEAIDRIEYHDDTFAPGNYYNLKRVATLLKNAALEKEVRVHELPSKNEGSPKS